MTLPPDVKAAPFEVDRIDELLEFVQRVCLAESGRKYFTLDELRTTFGMPGFDPSRDVLLLRSTDGDLVGAEWVETSPPFVRTHANGFVAPERTKEGIGTALLQWVRGVATSRLAEAPEGARVTLLTGVDDRHQPSLDLMRGNGMQLIRYFLEMRIDFDGAPPEPAFPGDIAVRTYRPGEDDVATYRAVDEAFQDHFGHVARPFEAGLERFRQWMTSEVFDPSLWWLAFEDGEIIGANLCQGSAEGDESIGYVGSLSVRKPWRGRGLAKALLRLAFGEFHHRGKSAAMLHVDAQNPTGATRLYEAVGMRQTERYAAFELEIRPGRELSVR